jgi:hypothetical protein
MQRTWTRQEIEYLAIFFYSADTGDHGSRKATCKRIADKLGRPLSSVSNKLYDIEYNGEYQRIIRGLVNAQRLSATGRE